MVGIMKARLLEKEDFLKMVEPHHLNEFKKWKVKDLRDHFGITHKINGKYENKTIRDFVNNQLLAIDSRELRKHMNEMQPDVDTTLVLIDNQSGDEFEVELPIGTDFFWPGA